MGLDGIVEGGDRVNEQTAGVYGADSAVKSLTIDNFLFHMVCYLTISYPTYRDCCSGIITSFFNKHMSQN